MTSPDHRLQNPENLTAPLFSRLGEMERFRLIDDSLCLTRRLYNSVAGVWVKNTWWTKTDPYFTSTPSDGVNDNIERVRLTSCTKLKKDKE